MGKEVELNVVIGAREMMKGISEGIEDFNPLREGHRNEKSKP